MVVFTSKRQESNWRVWSVQMTHAETSFEMIIFAKQFKGTHKTHKHTYIESLTLTDKKKSSISIVLLQACKALK